MKKILLASICLLTLTACSTTSQNKQENTPKQSQSQSKMSVEELKKSYSEDLKKSSMIENQEKLKGLKIHLKISEDKKNAIAIFDFDLSKIDQEQLIQSASDSESSQTFFRKLQDKPEVVFDYLKGQGLEEE